MNSPDSFWDPMLKATTLAWLNEEVKAEKHLLKLLELEPDTARNIKEMIATYVLSEELITIITLGLEKAGLDNIWKLIPYVDFEYRQEFNTLTIWAVLPLYFNNSFNG